MKLYAIGAWHGLYAGQASFSTALLSLFYEHVINRRGWQMTRPGPRCAWSPDLTSRFILSVGFSSSLLTYGLIFHIHTHTHKKLLWLIPAIKRIRALNYKLSGNIWRWYRILRPCTAVYPFDWFSSGQPDRRPDQDHINLIKFYRILKILCGSIINTG